ncbi:hypothetical protein T492DRAFT_1114135 [Pavlovales sp. CCMP2436]|nr:hypothetical protein T492DRAFT_1114135 [Pavlovales sp. CCMP2436]
MSAPEHVLDYRTSTCFPLHPARHGQEEPQGQKASVRNNPCFTSPVFFSVGLILLALLIFLEVTVASRALGPLEIAELVLIPVLLWFPALALLALTSPCVRFRIRTSRWGVRPTNKAAIVLAFTGPSPLGVAGGGFGYWIGSRRATPNIVTFDLNFADLVKMHSRPTRIVDEQSGGKYVLYDRGQFDQLSVGACVHTAAHGWAKEAWFIESVMAIEVVERGSGKVMEVRKDDADFLRCCFDERYVILDIEIALMTNQKLRVQQKTFKPPSGDKAADIRSGPDIAEWEQADFKLMFIYPTQIISKTAVKVLTDAPEVRNNSVCFLRCQFYALQLGCGQRTDFIDSVADAHTIVKTIWGLEALVVNLTRYVNLEIFTVDPFDMRSAMLTANRLHVKIGGRTEFCKRTVTGGTMIWAFDFAAPVGKVGTDGVGENLCEWIEEIHQHGYRRAALHPGKPLIPPGLYCNIGKYTAKSLSRITQIDYTTLWTEVGIGAGIYVHTLMMPA